MKPSSNNTHPGRPLCLKLASSSGVGSEMYSMLEIVATDLIGVNQQSNFLFLEIRVLKNLIILLFPKDWAFRFSCFDGKGCQFNCYKLFSFGTLSFN